MDEKQNTSAPETRENVAAGVVGALLFAIAGGALWFLLYQIGLIASITGLVGVILAIKGYALFAKKESVKGVILASVIAFAMLAVGWYFCIAKDIYDAYQLWFEEGEVDFTLTFAESARAVSMFLSDREIGTAYYKDLALGLLFALMGSIGTIVSTVKNQKGRSKVPAEATPVDEGAAPACTEENTAPLRSAETSERVYVFAKTRAYGHDVVYRRVGKSTEELVIDNTVYATCEAPFSFWRCTPHEMRAVLDGHCYVAGIYRGNYIAVDGTQLASTPRRN